MITVTASDAIKLLESVPADTPIESQVGYASDGATVGQTLDRLRELIPGTVLIPLGVEDPQPPRYDEDRKVVVW